MNINAITPYLNFNKTANVQNFNKNKNFTRPDSLNYLTKDTVSFSGSAKISKAAIETMEEITKKGYESMRPRYEAMGRRLLDTSEAIANRFEKRGVRFYRSYCERGVVKGKDSFFSKLLRSGEAPYDRVRTTLCIENPYDFKLIRDIFDEYKLRDYEIYMKPDRVSGRKILSTKPDFDIRLPGVTENDTKVLGPELQKCIGKPLGSGYSDIQARVVDTTVRAKDKPTLELLFVFGKHTLAAKELESYYSYDIRRVLQKELRVAGIKNPKIHTPAYRIQNNIEIICDILENSVSKPLFFNAKNKDFYHSNEQLPVGLSESAAKTIYGLLEGTRSKISLHYNGMAKKVSSDEYKPELEKIFKASEEYIERDDKTVYIQDLLNTRRQLIKELKLQKEKDLQVLAAAKERYTETAATDFPLKLKETLARIK